MSQFREHAEHHCLKNFQSQDLPGMWTVLVLWHLPMWVLNIIGPRSMMRLIINRNENDQIARYSIGNSTPPKTGQWNPYQTKPRKGSKTKSTTPLKALSKKAKGERKSVVAKYRGPNGEVWSGRGLTPTWMKGLLETGATRESFLIQASWVAIKTIWIGSVAATLVVHIPLEPKPGAEGRHSNC